MTKREITEREKWFYDRIGKIVWRNKTSCTCKVCDSIYQNGSMLLDEMDASYICDFEAICKAEGVVLRYFDTKEERDVFEEEIKD
jgi:hypothetical protein